MVNYKHKGGRVSMPSEFFGNHSHIYGSNPNAGYEQFAYGEPVAVSQGIIHNGHAGPNLGVFPLSSLVPTGGARKRRVRKGKKSVKRKGYGNRNVKRNGNSNGSGNKKRKSLKSRRRK